VRKEGVRVWRRREEGEKVREEEEKIRRWSHEWASPLPAKKNKRGVREEGGREQEVSEGRREEGEVCSVKT
jgi:hypothetical protein